MMSNIGIASLSDTFGFGTLKFHWKRSSTGYDTQLSCQKELSLSLSQSAVLAINKCSCCQALKKNKKKKQMQFVFECYLGQGTYGMDFEFITLSQNHIL